MTASGLVGNLDQASLDLSMSQQARPLYDRVVAFVADEVEPVTSEFFRLGENRAERWGYGPGQLELLDSLKARARAAGLWNFFLPDAASGEGLSNLDYAYIAAELGKEPDRFRVPELQRRPTRATWKCWSTSVRRSRRKQWLEPLLNGEIRSAYVMTEPMQPSSDAKNISTTAVLDGDDWVINGEKYWISNVADPRCKIMIVMVQNQSGRRTQPPAVANPSAEGHARCGDHRPDGRVRRCDDAPGGHMHLKFDNVRVPKENVLLGEGRGFEISQLRLGPGRIHHCMRSVGAAEKALDLMVRRGMSREAFGRPLAQLGGNVEIIARARTEIEAMRLMVLRAAKAMDTLGNAEARVWVSAVKAMVPERVCQIIDQAIQMHGAAGVSQWTPLAGMYTAQRTLRLADGPDEVHWFVVGRAEIAAHDGLDDPTDAARLRQLAGD